MLSVAPSLRLWRNIAKLVNINGKDYEQKWYSFHSREGYALNGGLPSSNRDFRIFFVFVYTRAPGGWEFPTVPTANFGMNLNVERRGGGCSCLLFYESIEGDRREEGSCAPVHFA